MRSDAFRAMQVFTVLPDSGGRYRSTGCFEMVLSSVYVLHHDEALQTRQPCPPLPRLTAG